MKKSELEDKVDYLWEFIHKLAKDVNQHRLVLRRYQRENKLTESVLLNEELLTYGREIPNTGTGIEYLNHPVTCEELK